MGKGADRRSIRPEPGISCSDTAHSSQTSQPGSAMKCEHEPCRPSKRVRGHADVAGQAALKNTLRHPSRLRGCESDFRLAAGARSAARATLALTGGVFYERVGLALTSSGSAIGLPHLLSFPPCYRGVTVVFCGRFGDTPSGCPNSFRGVDRPRKESTGHDVEGRSSDQPHAPQLITA